MCDRRPRRCRQRSGWGQARHGRRSTSRLARRPRRIARRQIVWFSSISKAVDSVLTAAMGNNQRDGICFSIDERRRKAGGRASGWFARVLGAALLLVAFGLYGGGQPAAALPLMGHLFGNANYGDGTPDVGVQLYVSKVGEAVNTFAATDEAGNWDAGALPPGEYNIFYSVVVGEGTARTSTLLSSEAVQLSSGEEKNVLTTLSGPHPQGQVRAMVRTAEGFGKGFLELSPPDVEFSSDFLDPNHKEWFSVPEGAYTITAGSGVL